MMEELIPKEVKPSYVTWQYIITEAKTLMTDVELSLSVGRGQTFLNSKSRFLERLVMRYDRAWDELSLKMANNSALLKELHTTHTTFTSNLHSCSDSLAEALDQVPTNPGMHSHVRMKLPEIKLPDFNGDLQQWPQFWDLFTSLVDKREDLPVSVKFTYLKNSLKGPSAKIISGFAVTEHNYIEAKSLLLKHYQSEDRCARHLIRKLYELSGPRHDYQQLSEFRVTYNQIVRSLAAFRDVDSAKWLLCEQLLQKLSRETQAFLFQHHKSQYLSYEELDAALEVLIQLLENSKATTKSSEQTTSRVKPLETSNKSGVTWSATVPNPSKTMNYPCIFCEQSHYSNKCPTYVSIEQRCSVLRAKRLCFKCTQKGHFASACNSKVSCFVCKMNHWAGLCPKTCRTGPSRQSNSEFNKSLGAKQSRGALVREDRISKKIDSITDSFAALGAPDTIANKVTAQPTEKGRGGVALPTAIFRVLSAGKQATNMRCFLDSGSQKSFIHSKVLNKLCIVPKKETTINIAAFGHQPEPITCPVVKLKLCLGKRVATVEFLVSDRVQMELHTSGLQDTVSMLREMKVPLADLNAKDNLDDVVAVIGADSMTKFVRGIHRIAGVDLIDTAGGFIIYGSLPFGDLSKNPVNQSIHCSRICIKNCDIDSSQVTDVQEPEVSQLWELDAIGIGDEKFTPNEKHALKAFAETIKYDAHKYWVRLPWKEGPEQLPTNYRMAIGQYKSLMRSLIANPTKLLHYDKVMQEYLANDFIEEVKEPRICGHYLPHHAVLKDSVTTPLRVVFNASAKAGGSPSLNDLLETGPSLTEGLVESLLAFRTGRYGLIADISKAFLRVGLQEIDRDFVRFLWSSDTNTEPRTYRFKSVLFGSTASPFLLQATLYKHFQDSTSTMKDILARSFYVDNFQVTVDDSEELYLLYTEANRCLATANFPLQEWNSNNVNFNDHINNPERKLCTSVLGVQWNTEEDTLGIKPVAVNPVTFLTKRKALSFFSSLFDPLGFLSPVSIKGKIFIRQLWLEKLEWDESLNADLVKDFNILATDYKELSSMQLPRSACLRSGNYELHVFCDASASAYGAAAYICNKHESWLLMSKARVAPIKTKTIPQLELTAVLLGCRLVKYISNILPCSLTSYIWSDNLPCLYWIRNNRSNIVYVQNRVSQILSLKEEFDIKLNHIDTKSNPADMLSRGCTVSHLSKSDLWMHGPFWLCSRDQWPSTDTTITSFEIITQDIPVYIPEPIFPVNKYSTLNKLLNVTNKVFASLHKFSNGKIVLQNSLHYWLHIEQRKHYPLVYEALKLQSHENKYTSSRKFIHDLNLCLDEHDIIRSRGRLDDAVYDYNVVNPILLPPKSFLCTLIIRYVHDNNLHAGAQETLNEVRNNYWIPCGRQVVKSIIKCCVTCRFDSRKAFKYPGPPPLPFERISFEHPFSTCGVDFTGALKLKVNNDYQKFYVCLFTCTATRAVHLELADSLSAESFIMSLRRFAARCSLPLKLISDNGTNFVATNRMLNHLCEDQDVKTYLDSKKIVWQFISPRAPWQGGFYERLIGIVKNCLHKALHKRQVSPVELHTILCEVEAVVNNRPLVYLNDDINSERALTPAHLLYGRKIKLYPNLEVPVAPLEFADNVDLLLSFHNKITFIINKFKQLWATEYLQSLREKHYTSNQYNLRRPVIGEVVILGLDATKDKWELGRIMKLVVGVDDQVREVIVLNKGHHLRKTVEKLIPLEVLPEEQPDIALVPSENDTYNVKEANPTDLKPQIPNLTESQEVPVRPRRRAAQAARELLQDLIEKDAL